MPFPSLLEEKIVSIAKQLERFGEIGEFRYDIADYEPGKVTAEGFDDSGWKRLKGQTFKRDQGVTWVRCAYTVPESCMDIPVNGSELRVSPVGDSYYFCPLDIYSNGKLLLSETAWMDCKCPEGILTADARAGDTYTIAIRLDYGEKSFWKPDVHMRIISDAVENCTIQLYSIIEELRYVENFENTGEILKKCYTCLENAVNTGETTNIIQAISDCRKLCEPLREAIKKNKVYVISHAHIDMNWFWPMEETERIIDRDFTTMTRLMERFSDFKFSQSQCATYRIEEKNNPETFGKMQKFIENGQWDVTASTWVEGDMNMSSGEAIARHILYSKQYHAEKFGKEPRIMWCPDTFGHPANTPQILKKSGISRYFFTRCGIGANTNEYDGFEYLNNAHHVPVFWWKGQDGSRVLAVNMMYNSNFGARPVLRLSAAMMNRFGYDKAMYTMGVGDHGGGPTVRDILRLKEAGEYPTFPTLVFSTTDEFYSQVEADNPPLLPERTGEMNFVFDGCYTTHADIKYYNRICENNLEATENLCVMASLYGFEYPTAEFGELWRTALFNQFHDIFDGSGVSDTYKFSGEAAEKVLARLKDIAGDAMAHIASHVKTSAPDTAFVVFNPTYAVRDCCVDIPHSGDASAFCEDGGELACQRYEGGLRAHVTKIPAMGYKVVYLKDAHEQKFEPVTDDGRFYNISSKYYDITIRKSSGEIVTLFDKSAKKYVARRETTGFRLRQGCLNTLQIHYEEPGEMSSWTIANIRAVKNLIDGAKSSIIEDGPVLKRIRFEHSVDSSTIQQDIVIYDNDPRIDFETHVVWNEYGDFDRDAPMLKVYFAPQVENKSAVYEIPFGAIERVTGDYECPALRWAHIGDGSYGFSLLNNSKHGYRCRGNGIELTLIRSGWLPDQKSDIGEHSFTYSILPQVGGWMESRTIQQASFLNNPVMVAQAGGGDAPASRSLVALDDESAPVCGVKRREDGGGIIVRVYNPSDTKIATTARTGFEFKDIRECDLLERPVDGGVGHTASSFEVVLNPHEFKSYQIDV